jgi:hypothetical protein
MTDMIANLLAGRDDDQVLALGDMAFVGVRSFPAKVVKALAVISMHLHPAYDALPDSKPGYSRETCMFSSLAIREFLVGIGYADATVRTCALIARSYRAEKEQWSVGLGMPGEAPLPNKFNGHAVVNVPSLRLMIDPTLEQVARRKHMDMVPPMIACEYLLEPRPGKLPCFAGIGISQGEEGIGLHWGDRPDINYRRELDFTDPVSRARRRIVAKQLVAAFGDFEE